MGRFPVLHSWKLGARHCLLERIARDELLKQALCSVGITYLVIRVGRSVVSLVGNATQRLAKSRAEPSNSDWG